MLKVDVFHMNDTQDRLIIADRIITEKIPFCRRLIATDGDLNDY